MAVAYYTRFTVEGNGSLPTDMLRYDGCYPGNSEAVAGMIVGRSTNPMLATSRHRIDLVHVGSNRKWEPTVGRWASFGWQVVQVQNAVAV